MKALAIAALAQTASAAARQRYAAVDMSPAGGALVPRFLIDAPKLAVRDGGTCNPNYHSCVDIGFPGTCCANTNYCYVKPDNQPWCCPVGSNCDSNCAATAYQCPTTVTRTVSETVTGAAAVVTTSVSSACCGRTCRSTSAFRCEGQFGGGCCSYGQTCVSGGGCGRAVTPTSSATALLTPVDPGCTATTQHACADGGCCDRLWDCVVVSGTAACAPGRPTATDVRIVDDASDGLSTGAKAGIGVGVSVVGCALVVLSAWFCLFRRRRRGTATASSRRSGGVGGASRVSGGVSGLGGGGGSERPERSARAMSEVTSSSRPTMWRGGTQDYFGPTAVAGPYTETETTTPGRGRRGVPLQAHSPSDVVAPVEMDSVGVVAEAEAEVKVKAAQERRYELYGSEVASPSTGTPLPPTQAQPPGSIAGVSTADRSRGPPVREGGNST